MTHVMNNDVFKIVEELAPKELAYDWDNVGLQVGSHNKRVNRIMVTLDVLENVVDEAIEKDVDLIIAHHPLIFKPLKQLNHDTVKGKIINKLIKHDITVYATHTNLDIAKGGVNDMLADVLHIKGVKPLVPVKNESLFKLVVFVPKSHQENIRDAFSEAGAGHIGEYSHCTFQTEGYGTFKPLEGTNPYSGTVGKVAFEEEVKIETIVEKKYLSQAIAAMIQAHPYEEVAYDVYPLENKGELVGLGRIGKLTEGTTVGEYIEQIKETLSLNHVRYVGNESDHVRTVAVLGGSGEKFIHQAKQQGADLYVTGDLTFHLAQEAEAIGLAVVDPGHYIEIVMKEHLANHLTNILPSTVECIVSEARTESIRFK